MKKQIFITMMASFLFAISFPSNVMAKKIMYKHHMYKGQVSKDNIPQGKGTIDISGIVIKGMFNGTLITEASFGRDWLRYEGNITFDESKQITLKAGGIITRYYYEFNIQHVGDCVFRDALVRWRKSLIETLSEDIKIDNNDILNDTIYVPYSFEMEGVPLELFPPKFIMKVPIPLKKYLVYGTDQEVMIHLRRNHWEEIEKSEKYVNDFLDEDGRIWNYRRDPRGYAPTYYKVTFPDGSYCSNETNGRIIKP